MELLPVVVCLLLIGLIGTLPVAYARAEGTREICLATSSPAGELVAPSHKTMSLSTWYQNRGPATVTDQMRDIHLALDAVRLPEPQVVIDAEKSANN